MYFLPRTLFLGPCFSSLLFFSSLCQFDHIRGLGNGLRTKPCPHLEWFLFQTLAGFIHCSLTLRGKGRGSFSFPKPNSLPEPIHTLELPLHYFQFYPLPHSFSFAFKTWVNSFTLKMRKEKRKKEIGLPLSKIFKQMFFPWCLSFFVIYLLSCTLQSGLFPWNIFISTILIQ